MSLELDEVLEDFRLAPPLGPPRPFGGGHINDTFLVTSRNRDGNVMPYIVQHINRHVFPHPDRVMENITRVTDHLRAKLKQTVPRDDMDRRVLHFLRTRDGQSFCRTTSGEFWRSYHFVGNAHTVDRVDSPETAYEAANGFGVFQRLIADMPPPPLHETIADFHNTPARFRVLREAVDVDAQGRASDAAACIRFAMARADIVHRLERGRRDGTLPMCSTHNDTKVNNVLLDDETGTSLCIIDLDTVMPGLALYDFGDLVRTAANTAHEDERRLDRIDVNMDLFAPLARGYIDGAGDALGPASRELMPFAGKLITFETGIRFLTDYLEGDRYFKTHHPHHNLERCRAQFRLVEAIEARETEMARVVAELA